jgi:precorrin-6A/cobalt-precorrin-6A reductase
MSEHRRILILGGTSEAVTLAEVLVAEGHDVTTSLAGRTKEPKTIAGKVRIGGFGTNSKNGATGLADYLKIGGFTHLIDATHPFATTISANAEEAARLSGVPLEVHTRSPWAKHRDDNWIEVPGLEAARDAIPSGANVLLALGSQHIAAFGKRLDVHFLVRMIDPPAAPLGLKNCQLIIKRPSDDWREEMALLKDNAITHLVCRNSGGQGAYAKIEAARALGLPVIIIGRPA